MSCAARGWMTGAARASGRRAAMVVKCIVKDGWKMGGKIYRRKSRGRCCDGVTLKEKEEDADACCLCCSGSTTSNTATTPSIYQTSSRTSTPRRTAAWHLDLPQEALALSVGLHDTLRSQPPGTSSAGTGKVT